MASVSVDEVKPGLVVHLDTDILRAIGGSKTNAEKTNAQDRAVVGPHYFLILEVDTTLRQCLAVPLFSKPADGSERLDANLKSGEPDKWANEDSHFSKWQHWHIPMEAIPAASENEESTRDSRRGYAIHSPKILQTMSAWKDRNRNAFRALDAPRAINSPRAVGNLTDAERERRRRALSQAKR